MECSPSSSFPGLHPPQGHSRSVKNVIGLIVALCGDMLRECLTVNEQLVKILLYDEHRRFYSIFEYVNHDAFDIASDAFRTFRVGEASFELLGNSQPRQASLFNILSNL